jgi:adenosylcobinamide-GDP ribazoletransferase
LTPHTEALGPAWRAGDELRAAIGFLTRLPVRASAATSGAAAFGLVGGILALPAAAVILLVGPHAALAAGVIGVGTTAVVSGAFHLDGLADTADALAAPTPEAAERARQDPRVGAAGAVAIAVVVAAQAALTSALIESVGPLLAAATVVVATAGSRAGPVLVAALPVPSIVDRGSASWFATLSSSGAATVAVGSVVALTAALAVWLGAPALLLGAACCLLLALATASLLAPLRGGLDGDGFGAIVELSFSGALLAVVLTT